MCTECGYCWCTRTFVSDSQELKDNGRCERCIWSYDVLHSKYERNGALYHT